jgi:hypothetical protein
MNQDTKKKYDIIENANNMISIRLSMASIGRDTIKRRIIFQVSYWIMLFLDINEKISKNIKNVRNGRKIIIPIIGNKSKSPIEGN